MKKAIALILTLAMSLSLAACSGGGSGSGAASNPPAASGGSSTSGTVSSGSASGAYADLEPVELFWQMLPRWGRLERLSTACLRRKWRRSLAEN